MITPRGLCLLAETACNPVIAQFVNIESYSTSGVQLSFQKKWKIPHRKMITGTKDNYLWASSVKLREKSRNHLVSFFFHNRCLAFYDNASQLVLQ